MTNGVVDFNFGGFGESLDFVPPALMAPLETFSLSGRTEENQRLFSVGDLGLEDLNTTFKDDALEEHLMASTLEGSDPWILFDSGAATHCCPKYFASEWPLLPLTGKAPLLRSISGQPLTIFGRRVVKVDFEGQSCFLHFYVCDVPYWVVSVGRLLRSGFDVNLPSRNPNTLSTPDGHKVPIVRHGSLLFLRPTLAPFNKDDFEVVCNTFHGMSAQGTLVAPTFTPSFKPVVQYHIDKWELSGNTLTRIHKRARATFFSPEGTKDRPVDLKDLSDERVTYFEYADGRKETLTDNWRKAANPKGPAPERFVGRTVFKLSSKPTGRKLVGKQTTLPEPTPLKPKPQPQPLEQEQELSVEAPQPLFKQPQKGLKGQSTEDTFRLRLQQTSSGTLEGFARATFGEGPGNRTALHARLVVGLSVVLGACPLRVEKHTFCAGRRSL